MSTNHELAPMSVSGLRLAIRISEVVRRMSKFMGLNQSNRFQLVPNIFGRRQESSIDRDRPCASVSSEYECEKN